MTSTIAEILIVRLSPTMLLMWTRPMPPGPGSPKPPPAPLADRGDELEDLLAHVLRCERWARFDDRPDLAHAIDRSRAIRPRR